MKKLGIFALIAVGGAAVATVVVLILGKAPASQVKDLMKQGQTMIANQEYEEGMKLLDQALEIEPGNEKLIDCIADGYVTWSGNEEKEGHIATALVLLDTGYEKSGKEDLAKKRDELEKNLNGVEKYWYLRRKMYKVCSNSDRVLKIGEIFSGKWEAHSATPYCAYYWSEDERSFWKQCIGELEEYRQYLLQNDMKLCRREWLERADLPTDVDQYFDYYETCDWLHRLDATVNDMDGVAQMWQEMVSNPDSIYEWKEDAYYSGVLYTKKEGDPDCEIETGTKYDEYGRGYDYDHFQFKESAVTIDYTFDGYRLSQVDFWNAGYREIHRCYYDSEGRLEEVYMDAGYYTNQMNMQYVLQFTYCEDGLVRIDLDSINLASGEEENHYAVAKINQYGDLEKMEVSADKMPERGERVVREDENALREEYIDRLTKKLEDKNPALDGEDTEVGGIEINESNFPDEFFRNFVKEHYDLNGNGFLSQKEINRVRIINMNDSSQWSFQNPMPCSSLDGLGFFTELEEFSSRFNQVLSMDFSQNKKLKSISINCNPNLKQVNVSENAELTYFIVSQCDLDELDVRNNKELDRLEAGFNSLKKIDISQNSKLSFLSIDYNQLTFLDISGNPNLRVLDCSNNQIGSLDLSEKAELYQLECHKNALTELDLRSTPLLAEMYDDGEKISNGYWKYTGKRGYLTVDNAVKVITE